MEELITVEQLAKLTGYSKQTIYNKRFKGEFVLGYHYFKPTRKKLLFRVAAIQEWLANGGAEEVNPKPPGPEKETDERKQHSQGKKPSPKIIQYPRRIII